MDDGSSIFMITALIVLIMLSAFFSASETAYSSLNMIRLKSRAEDGDKQAAKVLALAERYDSLLSTILIGNNIVNIGASSLATVLFSRLLGNAYGPTASTIVMTLLVLTFGEITPKSMAKEMPESIAMAFAPALGALVAVFGPLNFIFGKWKSFLASRFYTDEKDTITEGADQKSPPGWRCPPSRKSRDGGPACGIRPFHTPDGRSAPLHARHHRH